MGVGAEINGTLTFIILGIKVGTIGDQENGNRGTVLLLSRTNHCLKHRKTTQNVFIQLYINYMHIQLPLVTVGLNTNKIYSSTFRE